MRPEYQTKGYKLLRDGRYEPADEKFIRRGTDLLREALSCFVAGGAPKTAKRVRFALSSAKGACRNAGYRRFAAEQQRPKGHKTTAPK